MKQPLHPIFIIVVDASGRQIGNRGTRLFRFIPRVGEEVLIPNTPDDVDRYLVLQVVHSPSERAETDAQCEIIVLLLGNHSDTRIRPISEEIKSRILPKESPRT